MFRRAQQDEFRMDGRFLMYFKTTATALTIFTALFAGDSLNAQTEERTLSEPLFRISMASEITSAAKSGDRADVRVDSLKAVIEPSKITVHPLDPALEFAQQKLTHLRTTIHDYQAVMIKQERVDGVLLPAEYMSLKVRNDREINGTKQPFSVYMKFLRPTNAKGREVIYVDGRNDGNLVAHETGFLNIMRVNLAPTGSLAMKGNRYPITDAGIENLVQKLIERGQRDRKCGDCDVDFFANAKVLDRTCTMIQVKHDVNKAPYDFHIGRIYIDDEYQVPIRYEAYTWPKPGETELPLLESYTYAKLQINVGLTESDFDPNNSEYDFP